MVNTQIRLLVNELEAALRPTSHRTVAHPALVRKWLGPEAVDTLGALANAEAADWALRAARDRLAGQATVGGYKIEADAACRSYWARVHAVCDKIGEKGGAS